MVGSAPSLLFFSLDFSLLRVRTASLRTEFARARVRVFHSVAGGIVLRGDGGHYRRRGRRGREGMDSMFDWMLSERVLLCAGC